MVIAVIDGLLRMLQSWDMQASGCCSMATATAWFLMAEPLQRAKPKFSRPSGSTWGKERELQVHLASQQGGVFSYRAKIRAKAALEQNLKINLKAILGGSLEQRETQIPQWQAKLRSPS